MAAVDIAPLMDSPVWKSWEGNEAKRRQALDLWQDKDTSDADRSKMLQMMQGARQAAPAPPAGGTGRTDLAPVAEGGVQRLLANRPAESPIVGVGSAATAPQGTPHGAPFVPDEPPLQETHTKPSTMIPLVASGVLGGGPAVVGTLAGGADPANLGDMIGTTLTPGPLKPIAGAIGAGAGEGYRQWQAGEPLDWAKIGKETAWSAAPDIVESAGRGMVRQFARNSPGGQQLRFEQGARESRQLPERVFQPKAASDISQAFDQVRAAKVDVDLGDIVSHVTTLSPGKQADLLHTLTTLDRTNKTGGRYAQMYRDFMTGQSASRDIGALQDMRSHLRQEADMLADKSSEAYQLIRNFQRTIDDTIDNGLVSNATAATAQGTRDLLHQARRDWAQRMAADDLGDLVESKIRTSGDLSSETIQIRALYDDLRRGRSQASQSINRALDLTPGARDRFNTEVHEIARLYETIQIPMTSVTGISRMPVVAAVREGVSQLLLSDWGRRQLRDWILEGRGTLSPNAVAALVNVARRETQPALVHGKAGARRYDNESRRAPGGTARSTD